MKFRINTELTCRLLMMIGILSQISFAYAQNPGDPGISVPREGVAPLGELFSGDHPLFDVSSEATGTRVDTSSAGLATKAAPGEILPVSIKLLNFGGGKRVDVVLNYGIFSAAGDQIYSTSETVAVETTASFIKTMQIPFGTAPGTYTVRTYITYSGQVVPAVTQFDFTVERKVLGLYQSDFFLYGGIALIIAALMVLLCYVLIRNHRRTGFASFDYSDIPRDRRPFYEILSDTIMQMRLRVGEDALSIASHIEGLEINAETGRIIALTGPPAKIIAALVSEYEQLLGKKVSFSLRQK